MYFALVLYVHFIDSYCTFCHGWDFRTDCEAYSKWLLSVNVPPAFKRAPEPIEITEGDDLDLECLVTGKPLPDVVWYKDGEDVSKQKNVMVQTSENVDALERGSEIVVKDVDRELHSGKYVIEATNSVGTAKHEVLISGE